MTAQVLDAGGEVVDRVTVYRTDYGHGQGASLELPTPRAGWAALALQNADGTRRTIRLDRAAAAVPVAGPGRAGPTRPCRPLGCGRPPCGPVRTDLAFRSSSAQRGAESNGPAKRGLP